MPVVVVVVTDGVALVVGSGVGAAVVSLGVSLVVGVVGAGVTAGLVVEPEVVLLDVFVFDDELPVEVDVLVPVVVPVDG